MSSSSNRSTRAYATSGTPAKPWGWLGMAAVVIVITMTGAGWLYQKKGEWQVVASDDPRSTALDRVLAPDATSGSSSIPLVEDVRSPNEASSSLTVSPQSDPANAEPIAALKPPTLVVPEGSGSRAESNTQQVSSDSPGNAAPLAEAPTPSTTYTIQRGDTLGEIAIHLYGDGSQWVVVAEANPGLDPRRLRVGQVIKLPPRPRESE